MAHTDACKIQVTQLVKKLVENRLPINKACQETEQQSDGIPAETIRRVWYEIQHGDKELFKNEQDKPTALNSSEIQEKPSRDDGGKFVEGTAPGPGRRGKYVEEDMYPCECTEAMQFAAIAISQLSRIRADDPKKQSALDRVVKWIEQNR